ncbi:unnamed protein product [Rhizoctonia solani]|uniref:Uncharacterized protein n=1 Tax=Rhizoctonia solani TaxID=456999 RepID=A0A8H3D9T1_9AGAM|nr:unnamed protein product [Rhizoctonia solani]
MGIISYNNVAGASKEFNSSNGGVNPTINLSHHAPLQPEDPLGSMKVLNHRRRGKYQAVAQVDETAINDVDIMNEVRGLNLNNNA